MRKSYKDLLAEAEAKIETIAPETARDLLDRPDTLFVDLRDPREREREGIIPGAFPCPRGMLEFWIDPESPYHKSEFASGKRFVFFCAGGWRSALATATAKEMGLDKVCHIAGGFSAWRKAELPVATLAKKPG
ncbi:MAG: rhodanese-like domain-containing protein [Pseudomonadota bacterium]|nr:rhodanese-like domain-containing protein [Pseudomonadota bacterium]